MRKTVRNRLLIAVIIITSIACGIALMLSAMSDNIVFFYEPSKLHKANQSKEIRIGGLVKTGSLHKVDQSTINFILTDFKAEIKVYYQGIVPMLFRENQGVVVSGNMRDGLFVAKELLIKHDENYNPPLNK